MSRRYCPVCWQTVGTPTGRGYIATHFDSAGRDICPMSGELFGLAGFGRRRWAVDREYVRPDRMDRSLAS